MLLFRGLVFLLVCLLRAVLPLAGGTYIQAPFEEGDELTYQRMMKSLEMVNLENVSESQDNTDLQGELACAGGACEINL